MMSISTIARSGVASTSWMASLPVVAVSTFMPRRSRTLLSANTLRASSSTSSAVRPARISSESRRRSSMRCFSSGRRASTRCRNTAVSSSRRSGDSTPLATMLRAIVCNCASSSAVSSRPVNTITGRSLSSGLAAMALSRSKPDMSGRRRSRIRQSNVSSRSRSRHSLPVATATISRSSWPSNSRMPSCSPGLSSATRSRLVCRAV